MNRLTLFVTLAVSILLSFSYLPFFEDFTVIAKQMAMLVISLLGLMLAYKKLVNLSVKEYFKPKSPLLYLGFLILAMAWSMLFHPFSVVAMNKLLLILLTLLLVLILLGLQTSDRKAFISAVALFSLTFLTIWGWIELILAIDGMTLSHQASYSISASLGHRNLFAQMLWLLMMIALPSLSLFASHKKYIRALFFLAALLSLLILSRSAWLVAFVCLLGLILHLRASKLALSMKQARYLYGAFGIAVLLFFITIDGWTGLVHHVTSAFDLTDGTMRDRLLLAERSMQMFVAHPFSGVGGGNWPIYQMNFDQSGMLTEAADVVYMRPHNDFLWLFSEFGLLAGLAYVGLFVAGIRQSIFNYKRNRSLQRIAQLLGWLAISVASLNNFPIERPEFMIALAALLALSSEREVAHYKSNGKALVIAVTGFLVLCIAFTGYYAVAQNHLFKGLSNSGNESMLSDLTTAKAMGIKMDARALPLEWHIGNYYAQKKQKDRAKVIYESALLINPYHPYIFNALGTYYAEKRQVDETVRYFNLATKNTPKYPDAWLNIALFNYSRGNISLGFEQFLKADHQTENPLYEPLGTRFSIEHLKYMLNYYPEPQLSRTLEAIKNTPEWAFSIVLKSRLNNVDFETQAFIDACFYMLKNCQSQEECDENWRIKEKYIPNQALNLDQ
jgi:O-antigen ligase